MSSVSSIIRWISAAAIVATFCYPLPLIGGQSGQSSEGTTSIFTLSGATLHPVLAEALVEIKFGSEIVTGQTDTEGRYDILVDCNDGDAIVFVYVQGGGELAHVRATRVVDSCAALGQAAEPTGIFAAGAVSPVSTAAYALLRWYVDNVQSLSWPPDVDDMMSHRHIVAGQFAGAILQALPSMIAGHLPLLDGFDTTLELVLDRPALLGYIGELNSQVDVALINSARQRVLWDASLNLRTEFLTGLSSLTMYCSPIAFLCDRSLWIGPASSYYALGGGYGGIAGFEFRALQDRVFSDQFELPDDNLRAVRMTGEGGNPLSETQSLPFLPDFGQVEQRHSLEFIDLRILDASESVPLGSIVEKLRIFYPYVPMPDVEIISPFPTILSVLSSDATLPAWSGPQAGQSWHMPIFLGPNPVVSGGFQTFRYDRVTFEADGTGHTALSDLQFNWSMVDGVLELEGPDMNTHRYRFLGGELDRYPLFEVTYRPASEEVRSEVLAAIVDNGTPGFSSAHIPGRYWGGVGSMLDERRLLPLFGFPEQHLVFHLEADGMGWQAWMIDPEQPGRPDDAGNLIWTLEGDRLIIDRALNPPSRMARSWSVIAVHESTQQLFVNEVGVAISFDPDFELPNVPGRLNLFRRIDLPD